jgi:hypothetical protein
MVSYFLLRKPLNPLKYHPLFVIPGMNASSFCNNVQVINENLQKFKDRYREVIVFNLQQIKNAGFNFTKLDKFIDTPKKFVFDQMKIEISTHLDKIIRIIMFQNGYSSFDLMGISDGGGIATILAQYQDIPINQLILMSPILGEKFETFMYHDNFPNMKILLGWVKQDPKNSFEENLPFYQNALQNHPNYEIIEIDMETVNEELTHRLHPNLIDVL